MGIGLGLGGGGAQRLSASQSPVGAALRAARGAFATAAVLSGAVNVLMLSGSLFMLEVYDRVLPSRSLPTLVALVMLIVVIYAFQSGLEFVRGRLFSRIGQQLSLELSAPIFEANVSRGLAGVQPGQTSPFRDLEQLRNFLAGGGPSAIFDLPWMPVYLILLFLLHPLLGLTGLIGGLLLSTMTWLTDRATRTHQRIGAIAGAEATAMAEAARRNAESAAPLGMTKALGRFWFAKNDEAGKAVLKASDISGSLGGVSRFLRMALQSMVLALGAYLVIQGKATGGVMIAGSILLSRALAPVELAISHWRGFVGARQSYQRLEQTLVAAGPPPRDRLDLPPPRSNVKVEACTVVAPGARTPTVRDLSFTLEAGDALGVIGPSGAGKSTLARALVGVWPLVRGSIRLDGSTLNQWPQDEAGRFLGYLPQTVELFAGTIGQNIARFDPEATAEDILKAAAAAGLDQLIRSMPQGFDTPVGEAGTQLSAGQRQRVALARALYREPFFLVLDEPNSALDADGEAALAEAIVGVRKRGGISVIIAHRPSVLQVANKVLVLADGAQRAFGPREEVFRQVLAPVGQQGGPAPAAKVMQ